MAQNTNNTTNLTHIHSLVQPNEHDIIVLIYALCHTKRGLDRGAYVRFLVLGQRVPEKLLVTSSLYVRKRTRTHD